MVPSSTSATSRASDAGADGRGRDGRRVPLELAQELGPDPVRQRLRVRVDAARPPRSSRRARGRPSGAPRRRRAGRTPPRSAGAARAGARAARARSRPPTPGRARRAPGRDRGSSGSRARTPSSASSTVTARSGFQRRVSWTTRSPCSSARRLARGLVLEGVAHVTEGVHVLDLDLRAELGRAAPAGPTRWRRSGASPPPCSRRRPRDTGRWPGGSAGTRPPPAGERRSGRETISMSGTPARLKSTRLARRRLEHAALVGELADVLLEVQALDPDRGARRRRPRPRASRPRPAAPRTG